MSDAQPIIEGRGLTVARGGKTLVHVSRFAVEEGKVHALIGPNGAGKTTLLRASTAWSARTWRSTPRAGAVKNGADRLQLRRHTRAVLQKALLLATTVRGNVESGLAMRGVKGGELHRRAAAALAASRYRTPGRPSPDEPVRRRSAALNIARALAVDPPVVFPPTSRWLRSTDRPAAACSPTSRRSSARFRRPLSG